jgi:hypothetical protein
MKTPDRYHHIQPGRSLTHSARGKVEVLSPPFFDNKGADTLGGPYEWWVVVRPISSYRTTVACALLTKSKRDYTVAVHITGRNTPVYISVAALDSGAAVEEAAAAIQDLSLGAHE